MLHFQGETKGEKWIKAWDQLCKHLRVSSETANKALTWMHEQGIIGYSAFKNGVGIRIFLNRATSSIGTCASSGSKKILSFAPASESERAASVTETTFKDPFGVSENLDKDFNPPAPKNGADNKTVDKKSSDPIPDLGQQQQTAGPQEGRELAGVATNSLPISVNEIIERLRSELVPCVKSAAAEAASRAAACEAAHAREWFVTKALPKAVRVAQSESYNLLRKHGSLDERNRRARAELEVGRAVDNSNTPPIARPLTPEQISETAETCVALLEAQGRSIDVTLSQISAEGGGWLSPEDVLRVREAAQSLVIARDVRR